MTDQVKGLSRCIWTFVKVEIASAFLFSQNPILRIFEKQAERKTCRRDSDRSFVLSAGSTEGAECQWHTFSTDRNNYPKKVSNPMLTLCFLQRQNVGCCKISCM